MTTSTPGRLSPTDATTERSSDGSGPLGRRGLAVTAYGRLTALVWVLIIVGLGAFAPRVEADLSGAGWQANGSESVEVRDAAEAHFGGNTSHAIQVVVHSTDGPITEGAGADVLAEATRLLGADPRITEVMQPQPGATLSQDGSTAILLAGAGADTNEMVRAADDLKGPLEDLSASGVQVNPTGSSLLWSDFNEANLSAMLKSEPFSWPVTQLCSTYGGFCSIAPTTSLFQAGLRVFNTVYWGEPCAPSC